MRTPIPGNGVLRDSKQVQTISEECGDWIRIRCRPFSIRSVSSEFGSLSPHSSNIEGSWADLIRAPSLVQFEIYDFGFEMQDSSDFEIPDVLISDPGATSSLRIGKEISAMAIEPFKSGRDRRNPDSGIRKSGISKSDKQESQSRNQKSQIGREGWYWGLSRFETTSNIFGQTNSKDPTT
jgi:hypothetical protein